MQGGTEDLFGRLQKDFVVDKKDISMFTKKMEILIRDEDLANKLIKENLEIVKKYSTESVSDMYIERIFNNE